MTFKNFAVFGDPIEHSLSPIIHQDFANQAALKIDYQKIRVLPHEFSVKVKTFFETGGCGLNITAPLKELAYNLCEVHSERARLAKSVNTIYLNSFGQLTGDNTDGLGLIRDITQNLAFSLENKAILILGCGGAARGILAALLTLPIYKIDLINRTLSKAEDLQRDFGKYANKISTKSLSITVNEKYDVIINTLSSSIDLPYEEHSFILADKGLCYDINYIKPQSFFLKWLKDRPDMHYANGLGMLVEQAAESFYIWNNFSPDTRNILNALLKNYSSKFKV